MTVLLWLLDAIAVTLWLLVRSVAKILWRYLFTGQSVLGRPTDNATFLYAATQDLRGKPYEKLSDAIWKRLARRWAALGVPGLLIALSGVASAVQSVALIDPAWTRVPWLRLAYLWWTLAALAALAYGARIGADWLRNHRRYDEYVYPTWRAACRVLGERYSRRDARRMVLLPAGFESPSADAQQVQIHPVEWLLGPHRRVAGWALAPLIRRTKRFVDWRTDRRLARELAEIEAEFAAEEAATAATADVSPPEPREEPSNAELAVRGQAAMPALSHWPLLPRRVDRAPADIEIVEAPVRIHLPEGSCSTPTQQKNLLLAVGAVLGMPEPKPQFVLVGSSPYVDLWVNHPPPAAVELVDVQRWLTECDLDHPLAGVAAGKGGTAVPVYLDYLNNSPHLLVSGGSGTGKSSLVKLIESIRMSFGVGLIIVDYKRVSHRWAHNLDGCVYAWRIPDIHATLVRSGVELEDRIENVLPEDDDTESELVRFQTVDLVVEEINSLTEQLQRYWQNELRGPGDPQMSPAIGAIRRIINMGREYSMHVVVAGQRVSASVFGAQGGDSRESFSDRFLAKWSRQTWNMFAGGVPYQRFPGGGRGIWGRIHEDELQIIRVPLLTNPQARELAQSGVPCPGPLGGSGVTIEPRPDIIEGTEDKPRLVTLTQAVDQLPGPRISVGAIRKAQQRPGFPPKASPDGAPVLEFEWSQLVEWKLARDARRGLAGPDIRRNVVVYRFNTLDPVVGGVVCGYVGQTGDIGARTAQHRNDKPWADLIVGDPLILWQSDECTQDELDEMELRFIHTLLPLYNIEGNEGNPNRVPKWDQIEQRHARDMAVGRPEWVPVDIYNQERERRELSYVSHQ